MMGSLKDIEEYMKPFPALAIKGHPDTEFEQEEY